MLDTCTVPKVTFLACLCWQCFVFFKSFKSTLWTTKSSYTLKLLNFHFTVYLLPFLFTSPNSTVFEKFQCRSKLGLLTPWRSGSRSLAPWRDTSSSKKGRQLVGCASFTLKVSVNNLWSIGIVAVQLVYRRYIRIHSLYFARSIRNASIARHGRLEASQLASSRLP